MPISAPTTFGAGVVSRILAGPAVSFSLDPDAHPDGVIHPGQPVSIVWGVFDWRGVDGSQDAVGWADAVGTITYLGNEVSPPSSVRSVSIPIADRGASLANQFYRAGSTQVLSLTVTGGPPGSPTLAATLTVDVVPDQVDHTWFSWAPGASSFQWKIDAYTLSGQLRNGSSWTTFTFSPTLHETPSTTDDGVELAPRDLGAPSGSATTSLAPAASTDVAWAPITQTWQWFDRATFGSAPWIQSKEFTYTVTFSASDQFGNSYNNLSSAQKQVDVTVPDWKAHDVDAAFGLQTVAVGAAVTALVAAGAGPLGVIPAAIATAIAAASEAAAQAFATSALDPPAPDPNFKEVAVVAPFVLPKDAMADGQWSAVGEVVVEAGTLANAELALSVTIGRVLGAREAHDAAALQTQLNNYRQIISDRVKPVLTLPATLAKAQDELSASQFLPLDHDDMLIATAAQGLPQNLLQALMENGLAKSGLVALQTSCRDVSTLRKAGDLGEALRAVVHCMATITLSLTERAVPFLYSVGSSRQQ